MNVKALQKYIDDNAATFQELAKCGSVAELLVRLAVYGRSWGRWSWAVFIQFLWQRANVASLGRPRSEDCAVMLDDVIKTIDEGAEMDRVVTNKTVVLSMMQTANAADVMQYHGSAGLMCVLAHAFNKFPDMWNMNWMYSRRRLPGGKTARVHKLASSVPAAACRPSGYFSSDAFRQDFVHKYWNYSSAFM